MKIDYCRKEKPSGQRAAWFALFGERTRLVPRLRDGGSPQRRRRSRQQPHGDPSGKGFWSTAGAVGGPPAAAREQRALPRKMPGSLAVESDTELRCDE